jgi:hypothetical protein
MLTPYQFASNRPIDGIDLDGQEYLRAQEARIEVINGGVFIKISTLQTGIKSAYETANAAAGGSRITYDEAGRSHISNAISTRIGSVSFNQSMLNINSNKILPDFLPNPSPQNPDDQLPLVDAPPDAPRMPSINSASRVPNNIPYSLPSRGITAAGKAVGWANVAVVAAQLANSWLVMSEQDIIQSQADKYLMKAYDNLNKGIQLVPGKFRNTKDLSSILNVILSGENKSDNPEIYKIGMKIYDRFNSVRLKPAKGLDFMQNSNPVIVAQPNLSKDNNKQ